MDMWAETNYLACLAATIRLPFFEVYGRSIGHDGSMTMCELVTDYDPQLDIPYSPQGDALVNYVYDFRKLYVCTDC